MTVANWITSLRIILVPILLGCFLAYSPEQDHWRWVAVIIFVCGLGLDMLDGMVARHLNQVSQSGVVLDALADKLLFITAWLGLCHIAQFIFMSWIIFAVFIVRDMILLVLAIVYRSRIKIKPVLIGRVALILQALIIVSFLLNVSMPALGWYITLLISYWAAGVYIYRGWLKIREIK